MNLKKNVLYNFEQFFIRTVNPFNKALSLQRFLHIVALRVHVPTLFCPYYLPAALRMSRALSTVLPLIFS